MFFDNKIEYNFSQLLNLHQIYYACNCLGQLKHADLDKEVRNRKAQEILKSESNIPIETFSSDDLSEYIESGKLIITFNKNKITSSKIISKVIERVDVLDFLLKESSIEDIIKKIYRNEV